MKVFCATVLLTLLAGCATESMLIIGHRGASGYLPEHTMAAYQRALEQGADFIEPDLVSTRDGVLVARHENVLARVRRSADGGLEVVEATTNVHTLPQFQHLLTEKTLHGEQVLGWFSEDFTLAELKTLRARERMPALRPESATHDDRFDIPTFAEILEWARDKSVGVYPEIKQAAYFSHLGHDNTQRVLNALKAAAFTDPSRVFIQCFEAEPLRRLARELLPAAKVQVPLIQLMGDTKGEYADMAADLDTVATYASGVGVSLATADAAFIARAHDAGLKVHVYTLRAEPQMLPPGETLAGLVQRLRSAGVDGVFTDHVDQVRAALRTHDR